MAEVTEASQGADIDLDFSEPEAPAAEPSAVEAAQTNAPAASLAPLPDIADIDLSDLPGLPDLPADSPAASVAAEPDPLERKLALADEFQQLGDTDAAREILQEILEQAGEGPVREQATARLARLG